MYSRYTEIPTLDVRPGWLVEARYFNQVRRALARLGPEVRLSPPGLKHLDLILQRDAWIVVDRVLNDMPVVAWTAFHSRGRRSLHRPVACELLLFHAMASMVMNRTLSAMEPELAAALAEAGPPAASGKVLPFNPRSCA
ncbi:MULTISPECIES: hypothetical protein [unclassified Thioalkalivibrio]|uniref:hypothetical protein n=1 Tax=unclassified Thioalkalivibrio TaxID=2621013 RepID=UPI0003827217|nr:MULTISPECIES: hypothetical protein [unclassified Thioalkalivibrio]